MTEIERLACLYSDFYKAAHGMRPRRDISHWTVQDFEREFAVLSAICQQNEDREAANEAEAIETVEATIVKLISYGAGSRETAVRWLEEAHDQYGESLCYTLGLPYGYFKRKAA